MTAGGATGKQRPSSPRQDCQDIKARPPTPPTDPQLPRHGFGQHLRLTQQELADLVGASRPVVSTILNKLRAKGVLGYNREYVCVRRIEDIENLIDT